MAYRFLSSGFLTLALMACSAAGTTGNGGSGGAGSGAGASGGGGPHISPGGGSGGGGFVLTSATHTDQDGGCSSTLQVTYRDFKETHPDFQMAFSGDVVRRHLIQPTLGSDKKPQFLNTTGCAADLTSPMACRTDWSPPTPVITSAATFAQWYNDTPTINLPFHKTLPLTETPPGSGIYAYDSTSVNSLGFFPLAPTEGFGITPPGNWKQQNFLFTTEIHLMFGYVAGQKFTFIGDDDLWIFVNNKLALDLGSMHDAATGVIDFDAQRADLGITPGTSYPMDIFHAERHTDGSNFHVETNISCFTNVDITIK